VSCLFPGHELEHQEGAADYAIDLLGGEILLLLLLLLGDVGVDDELPVLVG